MKKPRKIGIYDLGAEAVELWIRPGTGAGFSTQSGSKQQRRPARITCGMDIEPDEVVGNLIHEAKEFCDMRMGCRHVPDLDYARDAAAYTFIETHTQHSELCARVGFFLAECLPDLQKAHRQWRKNK